MILTLFLIGIILIALIARYNESNKLFWTLLTAYTLSFAVTKMMLPSSSEQKDETTLLQTHPTQGIVVTPGTFMYLLPEDTAIIHEGKLSNPVGKDTVYASEKESLILSKITTTARDQPVHMLPNPPNTS